MRAILDVCEVSQNQAHINSSNTSYASERRWLPVSAASVIAMSAALAPLSRKHGFKVVRKHGKLKKFKVAKVGIVVELTEYNKLFDEYIAMLLPLDGLTELDEYHHAIIEKSYILRNKIRSMFNGGTVISDYINLSLWFRDLYDRAESGYYDDKSQIFV